jgi:hypothetical protein
MLKHARLWLPAVALTALVSTGCLLLSGQFVVAYNFKDHGYDPLTINSPITVLGVPVNLNGISAYKDHKKDLKDVVDLAIVGDLTNLDNAQPVTVEVWIVETPGTLLTSDSAVRAAGKRVWGPLTLAAGATKHVGWDESASLFVGRQVLVDQIKNDGAFDLYALGSGGYHFQITKGAVLAVIAAGK